MSARTDMMVTFKCSFEFFSAMSHIYVHCNSDWISRDVDKGRVRTGQQKLGKVIMPDKSKEGASDTSKGGGQKLMRTSFKACNTGVCLLSCLEWLSRIMILSFPLPVKSLMIHQDVCILSPHSIWVYCYKTTASLVWAVTKFR